MHFFDEGGEVEFALLVSGELSNAAAATGKLVACLVGAIEAAVAI